MLILDLPQLSYFSYVILTLTIFKLFSFLSIHFFFQTTVYVTVFVIFNQYFVNIYTVPVEY